MSGDTTAWLILGLRAGLVGAMFFGLTKVAEKNFRTQTISILTGLGFMILIFAGVGAFISWLGNKQLVYSFGGRDYNWYVALESAFGIGLIAFLWYAGLDMIQHFVLRLILWYQGHIPGNYHRFLDDAADHIFLQSVGRGYIFIHRLLLEHFAGLNEPTEHSPGP
jgi:hypothetical protein